ncbi:AraC family transcriptional regulator [Pedobacter sp. BMA]|uniref:helix-turn-helix domain-containing protein n=1 Tax=Pedobacter sp. BMA TaxID=1663685 RepID=UPI00064B14C5|nr:AraC family transcriptional regulator [Pedobacter sp. BMA]KLT66532.1 hypothetical protein AB669_04950 [Pedobacter sp. BMA]
MTPSEEIVTRKGESQTLAESVFLYNQNIQASYRTYSEDRRKVEIRLTHSDAKEYETFQMIFVLKGNVKIRRKGEAGTFAEIESRQHNFCRLPFKDTLAVAGQADEVICINISSTFLTRFLPADHLAFKQLFMGDQGNPLALALNNMRITPEIDAILKRLCNSLQAGFSDQLLLESKVIELFALQITQFEQIQSIDASPSLKKSEVERMQQARAILINQSGDQLSLRALAHLVGTNEFNLKRDFKLLYGKSVYSYLNQYKLEQAKEMLIGTDITIAEISKKTGYKHATHFTNAFKKYFGCLPNQIKGGKLSLLLFLEDIIAFLQDSNFLAA